MPDNIATDRVERQFHRGGPDRLRVTDITEHPIREGKVNSCVIVDTYSRRVVGWSIVPSSTGRTRHQRPRHGHRQPIWHNRKGRHSQLGWLTPTEFERTRVITVA